MTSSSGAKIVPGWRSCAIAIGEFVERELSLALKPEPYINRCRCGMDFLGCRVYPSHVSLEPTEPGSLPAKAALAGTRARGRSARRGIVAAACHGPGRLHASRPDGELALAEPGLTIALGGRPRPRTG